jgi:hypothetical protein
MGNTRTGEFSEAAKAPAVLTIVLDIWCKVAATPGDLVDVLVASAGAGLLTEAVGGRRSSESDAAQQRGGTDRLDKVPSKQPMELDPVKADVSAAPL